MWKDVSARNAVIGSHNLNNNAFETFAGINIPFDIHLSNGSRPRAGLKFVL